jgi:hypothetical protein
VVLVAPLLKIGFGARWQDPPPSRLEVRAPLVEVSGRAVLALSWIHAGAPFPLVFIDRAAGAARDRADTDVGVIDAPAVFAIGIAAAGEGEHSLFKRGWEVGGKPLGMVAPGEGDPSEVMDFAFEGSRVPTASRGWHV